MKKAARVWGAVVATLLAVGLTWQASSATSKPPTATKTAQRPTPPDTLVCVVNMRQPNGKVDMLLPIGGVYEGRWVQGESWCLGLPKGAQLSVSCLSATPLGSLTVTGFSEFFPPPVFCGFKGEWRIPKESDLQQIGRGHALAVWRRGGTQVLWGKATELDTHDPTFCKLARDFVLSKGLAKELEEHNLPAELGDATEIVQLVSVDLDRDGKDEVLMSVQWLFPADLPTETEIMARGQVFDRRYLVLVKTLQSGKPALATVSAEDDWYGDDAEQVLGCLDIDSDGKMEIVTWYLQGNPDYFRIHKWGPGEMGSQYGILYGEWAG